MTLAEAGTNPDKLYALTKADTGEPFTLTEALKSVAFTYAPKALPFPAIPAYTNAEAFYPLTKRLNQEVMIVENLAPGKYELAFNGRKAGSFSGEELGKGVNVALLDTPNQRRAKDLSEVASALRGKCGEMRNVFNMEKRILAGQGIAAEDSAAADAYFEKWVGGMETQKKPWAKYYRNCVNAYRKQRARKPAILAEIDDLYERMNAVRPEVSRVTVRRIAE